MKKPTFVFPTMGPKDQFYGYIVGVSIGDYPDDSIYPQMLATFEYNGKRQSWYVPDPELFSKLIAILGTQLDVLLRTGTLSTKLWIGRCRDGSWVAKEP